MKIQVRLVLALLTAFAVLNGARRLSAQEPMPGPTRRKALNPSSAFPPVNPSQAIPPINPSQTFPPITPSNTMPPLGPSRSVPGGLVDRGLSGQPAAVATLPLTAQIFVAVSAGPEQLRGLPPLPGVGIQVGGLRVETDRGDVILSGTVNSSRDKREAGLRAEEIAGRGKVINRLTVLPR